MQLMFETFNISGFYASEQAVLSLYAVGRISGCTVDIGHGKIGIYTLQKGTYEILFIEYIVMFELFLRLLDCRLCYVYFKYNKSISSKFNLSCLAYNQSNHLHFKICIFFNAQI